MSKPEQENPDNSDRTSGERILTPAREIITDEKPAEEQSQHTGSKVASYFNRFGCFLIQPKTIMEALALIVLIVYTHYAGQQAESAKTSADAANKAAQAADGALTETRLARQHAAREAQHAREISAAESEAADKRSMASLEASASQNQAALDATIRVSRLDQRPWIKVELRPDEDSSGQKVTIHTVVGQALTIPVRIINIGKTPATDVYSIFSIQIAGPSDKLFLPPDMFHPPHVDYPTHCTGTETAKSGLIFTDQFHDLPIDEVEGCEMRQHLISRDDIEILQRRTYLIYIAGYVTYGDAFGKPHWTRFCTWLPASNHNAQEACSKYNGANNNY